MGTIVIKPKLSPKWTVVIPGEVGHGGMHLIPALKAEANLWRLRQALSTYWLACRPVL